MQREEIIRIVGALDDASIADIEAMGTTPAELIEASNWLSNDEALISGGRHLPAGRIARLVEILETSDVEMDDMDYPQAR